MSKTKAGRRPRAGRSVQAPAPKRRTGRRIARAAAPGLVVVAALVAFLIAREQAQGPGEAVAPPPAGLPDTPDYHSLLVAPGDPSQLWLGTHVGLYESVDGGKTWAVASLEGRDAMNLVRSDGETVWTAGHNVLARSDDGAATWQNVDPDGLPSLDIHGFAPDPSDPDRLYAAVAGEGLYRSDDGGKSFEAVSEEVGAGVFGLAVTPAGRIIAGDLGQGLLVSDDGGATWRLVERFAAAGLAVNPADPGTIAAAGQGALDSGVILSRDGGSTWAVVLSVPDGAGPIAWAPSEPDIGYVVGFDKTLYTTRDGGATWQAVG